MILPNNAECARVIKTLENEPELTDWEQDFITSNLRRDEFTDKQKVRIQQLKDKYQV